MYMQIRMPLACLLILIYLFILYIVKPRLHTQTSRIFEGIAFSGMLHVLSAVVTEYTVNNRTQVSYLFNHIWHIIFLLSVTLVISMLYLYVILYVERRTGVLQVRHKVVLTIVTTVSILGQLFLPITYIDTAYGSYSYGPKIFSLYLIVVYTMVMMIYTLIRYKAVLNRDKSFVMTTSIIIFLVIALIQMLLPHILLTGLGVTMVLLGLTSSTEDVHMYTTAETGLYNELGCREILQEAVLSQGEFQVAVYIFIGRDDLLVPAMRSVQERLPERKYKVICGALADNLLVVIPLQWGGKAVPLPKAPIPDCCPNDVTYLVETMRFNGTNSVDQILETLRQFKTRYEADTLMRDDLTGLLRRAPFLRQVEYLIASGQSFSFLMTDLDNFKEVNDLHGHGTGDEVIRLIAEHMRSELRPTDLLCRMGGDEFGIVLPDVISRDRVIQITQRLQNQVRQLQEALGKNTNVTLSMGVKISRSENLSRTFQAVYAEADSALYRSKYKGKNRLTFSDEAL